MKLLILFLLPTLFLPSLFSDSKAAYDLVIERDDSINVRTFDGRPIFSYLTKPSREAEKHEPHFSRTGYLHPLYSPSGKIITGDYAPDHPHQHGLFFAWTKSSFRDQPTEFWNQKKKLGDIRFHRFLEKGDHPSFFSLQFEQIFTSGKDSDMVILKENWEIRVPKKQTTYFQFDLISTQTCATQDPLLIEKYHYGGMAIRGNKQWIETGADGKPLGKMITSEGKSQENGNHTRPRWVTMHGPVDGQDCGVVVMNHPDNFRFPQWVRLHPKMPYFVYAPMVEKPFSIEPDTPYISKFRYLTYDGTPDHQVIEGSWKEWIKN
tara:strand:+ start:1161 stop:2120 length:960 start_codon:yes stop_codon:yes gene_type:complete